MQDFDTNGIFYWLGTNGRTVPDWCNPSKYGLVHVTSSDGYHLPFGSVHDILSRDAAVKNCHTQDKLDSWFAVDTGLWIIPTAYSLRHARGYSRSALRNWVIEVSKDDKEWLVVRQHQNDEALKQPGSTATWPLEVPADSQGWRHVRLRVTGPTQSGSSHYLSLSGLELYGQVTGVVRELPTRAQDISVEAARTRLARMRMVPGLKVVRGPDWKWNNQDGDPPGLGFFLIESEE